MKILLNSFHTLKKVRTTFYNRQYHMKVFFDSFHFNGHTARLKARIKRIHDRRILMWVFFFSGNQILWQLDNSGHGRGH